MAGPGYRVVVRDGVAPVDSRRERVVGGGADGVGVLVVGGRTQRVQGALEALVALAVARFEAVGDGGVIELPLQVLGGGTRRLEGSSGGLHGRVLCGHAQQLQLEHVGLVFAGETRLCLGQFRTRGRRFLAGRVDVAGVQSVGPQRAQCRLERAVVRLARRFEHLVSAVLSAGRLEPREDVFGDGRPGPGVAGGADGRRVPQTGPHRVPLGRDGRLDAGTGRRPLVIRRGRCPCRGACSRRGACLALLAATTRDCARKRRPGRSQYLPSCRSHRVLGSPKQTNACRFLGKPKTSHSGIYDAFTHCITLGATGVSSEQLSEKASQSRC